MSNEKMKGKNLISNESWIKIWMSNEKFNESRYERLDGKWKSRYQTMNIKWEFDWKLECQAVSMRLIKLLFL
jgi:hypothetical protein